MATRPVIPAMSAGAIRAVRALVRIAGAHITIPTLPVVSGGATLFIGEDDVELQGQA